MKYGYYLNPVNNLFQTWFTLDPADARKDLTLVSAHNSAQDARRAYNRIGALTEEELNDINVLREIYSMGSLVPLVPFPPHIVADLLS